MNAPLRPPATAPYGDEDDVDIWQFVVLGWWARWFLVGGAVIGLLVAWAFVAMKADVYRSQLTLSLVRQNSNAQLAGIPPMQVLATSPRIADEVSLEGKRLGATSVLRGVDAERVIGNEKGGASLEVLWLMADAGDAASAQAYAQAYANVLAAQAKVTDELFRVKSKQIADAYPLATNDFNQLSRRRAEAAGRHAAALNAAKAAAAIETRQVELAGRTKYAVDLDARIRDARVDLEAARSAVAVLEKEIAGVRPALPLNRGIEPVALWMAIVSPPAGRSPLPADARVVTEVENPIYTKLAIDLADQRTRVQLTQARVIESEKQRDQVNREIDALQRKIADGATSVTRLQELQSAEMVVFGGELDAAKLTVNTLANSLGEAKVAGLTAPPQVVLSKPGLPESPLGRPYVTRGLLGMVAGMLLGALAAWVWGHLSAPVNSDAV